MVRRPPQRQRAGPTALSGSGPLGGRGFRIYLHTSVKGIAHPARLARGVADWICHHVTARHFTAEGLPPEIASSEALVEARQFDLPAGPRRIVAPFGLGCAALALGVVAAFFGVSAGSADDSAESSRADATYQEQRAEEEPDDAGHWRDLASENRRREESTSSTAKALGVAAGVTALLVLLTLAATFAVLFFALRRRKRQVEEFEATVRRLDEEAHQRALAMAKGWVCPRCHHG